MINGSLVLKAGETLDFEADGLIGLIITATAADPTHQISAQVIVPVTDVNETATGLTIDNAAPIAENAAAPAAGTVIATLAVMGDPDLAADFKAYTFNVTGAQAAKVEVVDGKLVLKAGQSFDFETSTALTVTAAGVANPAHVVSSSLAVAVTDVNEAPTGVTLSGPAVVKELAKAGTVVGALKAIDPDFNDLGKFDLIKGAADRFEIVNGQLVVKNGVGLDYEQAKSHQVVVEVTDQGALSVQQAFSVQVLNVRPEVTAGSAFNDVIFGDVTKDRLSGGLGNDLLKGAGAADVLRGDAGNDKLYGGLARTR